MVQYLFKEKIAEQMGKTGLTPSDPDWIRQFQLSVNTVIKSLGAEKDVLKKYGAMAADWNKADLPDELKWK